MRVIVYVEGPSDKYAMEELLKPLLERKLSQGVRVEFYDKGGKPWILTHAPVMACNITIYDPDAVVVAMPDLYPKNKSHETEGELESELHAGFDSALRSKGIDDNRLKLRFHVFCFKHDLEALLLAAEAELRAHLGASRLTRTWRVPVEDQNHDRPPKRVVEEIFRSHDKLYRDTNDAPDILARADYIDIAKKCPQCFKPFVEFLESCG